MIGEVDLGGIPAEQLGTRPRETTHYLNFETAEAADEAASQARAVGFTIEIGGPAEGREDWQVRRVTSSFEMVETAVVDERQPKAHLGWEKEVPDER